MVIKKLKALDPVEEQRLVHVDDHHGGHGRDSDIIENINYKYDFSHPNFSSE